MEAHNANLVTARDHLIRTALQLDLPGGTKLLKDRQKQLPFKDFAVLFPEFHDVAASAGAGASAASTSAAVPASAASTAVAQLLVGALRNGRGLELPQPPLAPKAEVAEGGDSARKRPREGV